MDQADKSRIMESFKVKSAQVAGMLDEFYSAERMDELSDIASKKKPSDKERIESIRRDLDVLRYELIELMQLSKKFKKCF